MLQKRAGTERKLRTSPKPDAERGGERSMNIIEYLPTEVPEFPHRNLQLAVVLIEAIADLELDFEEYPRENWPEELKQLFPAGDDSYATLSDSIDVQAALDDAWTRYWLERALVRHPEPRRPDHSDPPAGLLYAVDGDVLAVPYEKRRCQRKPKLESEPSRLFLVKGATKGRG